MVKFNREFDYFIEDSIQFLKLDIIIFILDIKQSLSLFYILKILILKNINIRSAKSQFGVKYSKSKKIKSKVFNS